MILFIVKRVLAAIPTLLLLMTLTFFAMKAIPGGPFDGERALPEEIKANIAAKYHFDEPIWKQYFRYMGDLSRGDLGPSFRYLGGRSVNAIVAETLPVSASLGFMAVVLSILFGVPIGILAAYYRKTWIDGTLMFVAVAGISLPNFLVASLLVIVFSSWLGWLPPALWEGWSSMVLPVITLAIRPVALVARMTRASIIETLELDYIRTAKAKGLSTIRILFFHALKNALIPVVSLLGPLTAAIITGSFVVEVVFAIPGLGKHFVSAVIDRDYTLIMGVTIVYGLIVVSANLIVDVLYGIIDPRIRQE